MEICLWLHLFQAFLKNFQVYLAPRKCCGVVLWRKCFNYSSKHPKYWLFIIKEEKKESSKNIHALAVPQFLISLWVSNKNPEQWVLQDWSFRSLKSLMIWKCPVDIFLNLINHFFVGWCDGLFQKIVVIFGCLLGFEVLCSWNAKPYLRKRKVTN